MKYCSHIFSDERVKACPYLKMQLSCADCQGIVYEKNCYIKMLNGNGLIHILNSSMIYSN